MGHAYRTAALATRNYFRVLLQPLAMLSRNSVSKNPAICRAPHSDYPRLISSSVRHDGQKDKAQVSLLENLSVSEHEEGLHSVLNTTEQPEHHHEKSAISELIIVSI